jgi:hypothetical protein
VGLEGLGQLKNPMTSSVIEYATIRLAAYCLNQVNGQLQALANFGPEKF